MIKMKILIQETRQPLNIKMEIVVDTTPDKTIIENILTTKIVIALFTFVLQLTHRTPVLSPISPQSNWKVQMPKRVTAVLY